MKEYLSRLMAALLVWSALAVQAEKIFVVAVGLRAQSNQSEGWAAKPLIGKTVPALTAITPETGKVFVEGEY